MSTLATVFGYGLVSARPAASVAGRFYYGTDTSLMYRDNGSTWDTLTLAGAGTGTLTTVKDEGSNLSTAVVSVDFVGAGVTATGTTAVTVTIPGTGTALQAASYRRTSGDYTTTSASFADIDGTNLALTITTGAHRVMCVLQGEIESSAAATTAGFDILVDGSSLGGGDGLMAYAFDNGAGYRRPLNLVFITDALTAASHTFKAQWKIGTGTLTAKGGTGAASAPLKFTVIEQPA